MSVKNQISLPFDGTNIFEIYEKTSNREFKTHVCFMKADSLSDAQDKALQIDSSYWKTMSVRHVENSYVWKIHEKLHYAFRCSARVLGIEQT